MVVPSCECKEKSYVREGGWEDGRMEGRERGEVEGGRGREDGRMEGRERGWKEGGRMKGEF